MFKHDPYASTTYGKEKAQAVKRVTQDTFDEVVQENVEEFEMEPEEALADAIKQFELEGVDLSNIDKRVPGAAAGAAEAPAHPLLVALSHLQKDLLPQLGTEGGGDEAPASKPTELLEATASAVSDIAAILADDEASRSMAATNGLVTTLVRNMVRLGEQEATLLPTLAAIRFACIKSDENREHFASFEEGPDHVSAVVTASLDKPRVLENAFHAIAQTAKRHEGNKLAYVRRGMLGAIGRAFDTFRTDPGAVRAACAATVALCTGDDFRRPTSKAVEHARFMADPDAVGVVPKLAAAAEALRDHEPASTALALAVKALAVRDEICDLFFESGVIDWAVHALTAHGNEAGSAAAARAACAALATLARNDRNKCAICEGEALPAVLAVMQKHADSAPVLDQGLAVLATVCLRHPMNVELVMDSNGAHFVVDAMRKHLKSPSVQKQGCLALRNMAARNVELRPHILEQGAEAAIRAARDGHPRQCADLAFAALRDLGLDYR